MILTPTNYLEQACKVNFEGLSKTFSKGHELAKSAFKDKQAAYKANSTVKTVMDAYLDRLNEELKKPATRKPRTPTIKKVLEKDAVVATEVGYIRRYLWLDGKVRSKESVMTLLRSLQRAIVEKRIRKTSPYASQIAAIQASLIGLVESMDDSVRIAIDPKVRAEYLQIIERNKQSKVVSVIRQFISLQGKHDIYNKAVKLMQRITHMVANNEIEKYDPLYPQFQAVHDALTQYFMGVDKHKDTAPAVINQQLGQLPEVISSTDLLKMEFETIGLEGKWKDLIGDPSVGFSMMVYGQPKSGKSTLMLEFAQYLAEHHGKTLYVAIEEGFGYTLKEKIQRIGATSPNLSFAAKVPTKLDGLAFVFIDSISRGGFELEDLIQFREANPKASFIYIFHTTKDGRFRGGNQYAHEVDVILEVSPDEIHSSGRFAMASTQRR
jgi:hypothetical protein